MLGVLAGFPDESVNCVVTSPPYWGLRDYGLEQQIWDAREGCEHEWGKELVAIQGGGTGSVFAQKKNYDLPIRVSEKRVEAERSQGCFCVRCCAWRGSLGLEPTPELYVQHLVQVFREVKRVMRNDGTLWLNLGDSYHGSWGNSGRRPELDGTESYQRDKNTEYIPRGGWNERRERPASSYPIQGLKPKDLVGVPWRVAFALQADGWWLRSDIIWSKPNPMPESVTDRPTKAHEYVFLLSKSANYYFDADAIREPVKQESLDREKYGWKEAFVGRHQGSPTEKRPYSDDHEGFTNLAGRNKRSVWTINTQPYKDAHFATFPEALVEPMVKAGCPEWVCGTCGEPRTRIVNRESPPEIVRSNDAKRFDNLDRNDNKRRLGEQLQTWYDSHPSKTVGWSDCGHANFSAGVVLDPFCGSGTTCLVAAKLNRDWIGIDLSEKYCTMARERVAPYAVKLSGWSKT